MDKIFYKHGIDWIQWKDKDGNTWVAGLEEVQVFGKECFEQMPSPEDHVGSWSVTYDDDFINYEPVTDEEWNEIINL